MRMRHYYILADYYYCHYSFAHYFRRRMVWRICMVCMTPLTPPDLDFDRPADYSLLLLLLLYGRVMRRGLVWSRLVWSVCVYAVSGFQEEGAKKRRRKLGFQTSLYVGMYVLHVCICIM